MQAEQKRNMILLIIMPAIALFILQQIIDETDEERQSREPVIEDYEYYLRGE